MFLHVLKWENVALCFLSLNCVSFSKATAQSLMSRQEFHLWPHQVHCDQKVVITHA